MSDCDEYQDTESTLNEHYETGDASDSDETTSTEELGFETPGEAFSSDSESEEDDSTQVLDVDISQPPPPTQLTLEGCTQSVLKDIKWVMSLDRNIIRDQERYWIRFKSSASPEIREALPAIILKESGRPIKWIATNEIEIELLDEDERAEVHHQKKLAREKAEREVRELIEYQKLHPPKPQPARPLRGSRHSRSRDPGPGRPARYRRSSNPPEPEEESETPKDQEENEVIIEEDDNPNEWTKVQKVRDKRSESRSEPRSDPRSSNTYRGRKGRNSSTRQETYEQPSASYGQRPRHSERSHSSRGRGRRGRKEER